jgi:hypothetical protein
MSTPWGVPKVRSKISQIDLLQWLPDKIWCSPEAKNEPSGPGKKKKKKRTRTIEPAKLGINILPLPSPLRQL